MFAQVQHVITAMNLPDDIFSLYSSRLNVTNIQYLDWKHHIDLVLGSIQYGTFYWN